MGYTIREKYERADDWREKAKTINFYHKLEQMKNPKHYITDTAKYFDISRGAVCEDVQLAENMDFVGVCPSRKMALAMLKESPVKKSK